MADFPYTQVTGKLKSFFEKIQQIGKPELIDKKWLASIGLTASNDPTIVPVLKFIDFVDSSSKPTERWIAYRDKSRAKTVLAEGIRKGYDELFQTYPDAYRRGDNELKDFFTMHTSAGFQAISKTVTTFKTLCELADFEGVNRIFPTSTQVIQTENKVPVKIMKGSDAGVTININIQLTLPDTTDENVYNKLFEAMKKNLLS
ncbi:MAG: DUF5343 domain-containing protein [Anaerolineales bacterium]|nr:DUF5343 domain-containing protein [Anaerolineales bacterium]